MKLRIILSYLAAGILLASSWENSEAQQFVAAELNKNASINQINLIDQTYMKEGGATDQTM